MIPLTVLSTFSPGVISDTFDCCSLPCSGGVEWGGGHQPPTESQSLLPREVVATLGRRNPASCQPSTMQPSPSLHVRSCLRWWSARPSQAPRSKPPPSPSHSVCFLCSNKEFILSPPSMNFFGERIGKQIILNPRSNRWQGK